MPTQSSVVVLRKSRMEGKRSWRGESIRHNSEIGIIRRTRAGNGQVVLGFMEEEVDCSSLPPPCSNPRLRVLFSIMFGFNPSVLPWWLWLFCAVTTGFTWFQAGIYMSKKQGSSSFIRLLYYLFGAAALLCAFFTLASLFKLFDR
jgi:hypothetical protein